MRPAATGGRSNELLDAIRRLIGVCPETESRTWTEALRPIRRANFNVYINGRPLTGRRILNFDVELANTIYYRSAKRIAVKIGRGRIFRPNPKHIAVVCEIGSRTGLQTNSDHKSRELIAADGLASPNRRAVTELRRNYQARRRWNASKLLSRNLGLAIPRPDRARGACLACAGRDQIDQKCRTDSHHRARRHETTSADWKIARSA